MFLAALSALNFMGPYFPGLSLSAASFWFELARLGEDIGPLVYLTGGRD
jgi:hypothetical protein